MNLNRTRIVMLGTATLFLPAFLFAQMDSMAVPVSASQADEQQQQTPSPSMQDSGPNEGDVGQIMKDKMFLRGATADGIAEIKLGQLAAAKAGSDDVKAFGQKMVDDHTRLNGELASVADSMGVMLPKDMSKAEQTEYDKLQGMSGADFDTEYLTAMVKGHHRALRDFRVEANSVSDPALTATVMKGEDVIHGHLVMVNALAKEKGIPMPVRHRRPTPPRAP